MKPHNDLTTYRKCSEPFQGGDLANGALDAFGDELVELRKKHRIKEVVCIVAVAVLDAAGEETEQIATIRLGGNQQHLHLIAQTYGAIKAQQEEDLRSLIARASRR